MLHKTEYDHLMYSRVKQCSIIQAVLTLSASVTALSVTLTLLPEVDNHTHSLLKYKYR